MTIRATPIGVRLALARIVRALERMEVGATTRQIAELVLAEVLNNVAEHAYSQTGNGDIGLKLHCKSDMLCCEISDRGAAMPGGVLPAGRLPETVTTLADLPEGGFGWALIRSLTRDLAYARQSDGNRLKFGIALCNKPAGT